MNTCLCASHKAEGFRARAIGRRNPSDSEIVAVVRTTIDKRR